MWISKVWSRLATVATLVGSPLALAGPYEPGQWNMPEGVTEISRDVYRMHMGMFWLCVVIGLVVFGAMFYSVFAHRRSKHPKPADFHESTTVEIIWTIIPFVILVVAAIPAAGTLIKMEDVRHADMSVKVTGYQWKWNYEYMDQGVSFFSTLHPESNKARQLKSGVDVTKVPNYLLEVDNHLVLPTGKKIRFLITANDVIHAWWVPDFAIKKDAIPGFVNEVWTRIEKPGLYRGVCAELCGRDHGFMPIVVEAVEPKEFDQWLAAAKAGQPTKIGHGPGIEVASSGGGMQGLAAWENAAAAPGGAAPAASGPSKMSKDELMKKGQEVYGAQCVACHQASGEGLPPNFPTLHGSKVANGPAPAHIQQILNGKGLMTPFKQLSDQDIAAVATFERASWGNKGSVVQPADVAAQRSAK
jgi:cytochrome c oxidase subunit 2